jgi:hypothetical protein
MTSIGDTCSATLLDPYEKSDSNHGGRYAQPRTHSESPSDQTFFPAESRLLQEQGAARRTQRNWVDAMS